MSDFKFWSRATAERLRKAKDYADRAGEAIAKMYRQAGPLRFDQRADRISLAVR